MKKIQVRTKKETHEARVQEVAAALDDARRWLEMALAHSIQIRCDSDGLSGIARKTFLGDRCAYAIGVVECEEGLGYFAQFACRPDPVEEAVQRVPSVDVDKPAAEGQLVSSPFGSLANAMQWLITWGKAYSLDVASALEYRLRDVDLWDIVGLATDPVDDRPLCPLCGAPLYAAIEEYASGVIPFWGGRQAAYDGFDADPDGADHSESDLSSLYCRLCGWRIDPRETEVMVSATCAVCDHDLIGQAMRTPCGEIVHVVPGLPDDCWQVHLRHCDSPECVEHCNPKGELPFEIVDDSPHVTIMEAGGLYMQFTTVELLAKVPEMYGGQGYLWERRLPGACHQDTWDSGDFEHRTLEEAVEAALPNYKALGLSFDTAAAVCLSAGLVLGTGAEIEEEDDA
jgi:hypothetical protein